jgi:hypothetical protein
MSSAFFLFGIITLVNFFWVFGFFIRFAGVETKKLSTSNSIFQIINLIPRTIGVFQIPLVTLYIEKTINKSQSINISFFQTLIFFNLIGILLGIIALPIFLRFIKIIINKFYESESFRTTLPKLIFNVIFRNRDKQKTGSFFYDLTIFKIMNIQLFIYNTCIGFLLAVAFPACAYVGYLISDYRATIVSFVSVIYGFAVFINILLVETKLAIITDKTFHGEKILTEFKMVLLDCLKGRTVGILLGIITLPIISEIIKIVLKKFLF